MYLKNIGLRQFFKASNSFRNVVVSPHLVSIFQKGTGMENTFYQIIFFT